MNISLCIAEAYPRGPRRQTTRIDARLTVNAGLCDVINITLDGNYIHLDGSTGSCGMMTPAQMRAARALLGIDQKQLAELSGVSLPTIQRMEGSEGNVRGVVETLTKVVEALERAGVELIADNAVSSRGGRGVRLKQSLSSIRRAR
jgi:DNA-binding XRE family transcriptional regulator